MPMNAKMPDWEPLRLISLFVQRNRVVSILSMGAVWLFHIVYGWCTYSTYKGYNIKVSIGHCRIPCPTDSIFKGANP